MLRKNELVPYAVPSSSRHRWRRPISQFICSVILYMALTVIVLLGIPVCLLLGVIGVVWAVADRMIRVIERITE